MNRGGEAGQFTEEQCEVIQSADVDAVNLCQCISNSMETNPPEETKAPSPGPTDSCYVCGNANAAIGDTEAVLEVPRDLKPTEVKDLPLTCKNVNDAFEQNLFSSEVCSWVNSDQSNAKSVCQCMDAPPTTETTQAPTQAPTISPKPTEAPTTAAPVIPTAAPSRPPLALRSVEQTIENVVLFFDGVTEFDERDQSAWARATKRWFNGFYKFPRQGVANMITNIINVRHESKSGGLQITFDFIMVFDIVDDSAYLGDIQYLTLPFQNKKANDDYVEELSDNVKSFRSVKSPIAVPTIGDTEESSGLSAGIIAGIAVGGVVLILLVIGVLLYCRIRKQLKQQTTGTNSSVPEQHDPEAAYVATKVQTPAPEVPDDHGTYVVNAPAGKLLIVLDKFDDDGPVVIVIKGGLPRPQ